MMIGVSYNEFDVSTYEAVYLYYGAERQCEQFASGDPAQDFKAALAFAERVATTPGEGPLRFHRDRPDLSLNIWTENQPMARNWFGLLVAQDGTPVLRKDDPWWRRVGGLWLALHDVEPAWYKPIAVLRLLRVFG